MPTLFPGATSSLIVSSQLRSARRGVTLMELVVVMALIGLMVAVSFPSVSSGIDTLRLTSGARDTVGFLNSALIRAERRQQVVDVVISRTQSTLSMRTTEGLIRTLEMPDGVTIEKILPEVPGDEQPPERNVLLYPAGSVPRIGVQLINRRHDERIVRVDPITGVAQVERVPQAQ